jgi:hypothetical protein
MSGIQGLIYGCRLGTIRALPDLEPQRAGLAGGAEGEGLQRLYCRLVRAGGC